MLPNFLIIGAMKSGTTTLYHLLKSHPDIFMATNKEPQFFSDIEKVNKNMDWYESLFNDVKNEKAIGEASTNYAKYPAFDNVAQTIKENISDAKIIYVLRNPVERVYSHFIHNYLMGRVDNNFFDAIKKDAHYINVSKYFMQLQQYLDVFDEDRIKVVLLEDLRDKPNETIADIYDFLEVDNDFKPQDLGEHKHKTKNKSGQSGVLMKLLKKFPYYYSISNMIPEGIKGYLNKILRKKVDNPDQMSDQSKEYIVEKLKDDIELLMKYLNKDLSMWVK